MSPSLGENVIAVPGDVRRFERVTVTKVVVLTGHGTPTSPVREVTHFYDDDGLLIARHDPIEARA